MTFSTFCLHLSSLFKSVVRKENNLFKIDSPSSRCRNYPWWWGRASWEKLSLTMFLLLETSEVSCLLLLFFEDNIDDAKYCGRLYGLGSGSTQNQNGISSSSQEETNNKHWPTTRPSSGRLTCFIPSGRCFSSPLTPRRKHEINFCIELHQLQKGHWLPQTLLLKPFCSVIVDFTAYCHQSNSLLYHHWAFLAPISQV